MPLPPPRKATTTGRLAVARATSPSKVKASGSECLRAGLPDSQIKDFSFSSEVADGTTTGDQARMVNFRMSCRQSDTRTFRTSKSSWCL
ncbi:hypothetical protein MRX96_022306 [Rhipicephalus microplus]